MLSFHCGHIFCYECWGDYLKVRILTNFNINTILCPASGCKMQIDELTIKNVLKDQSILDRYYKLTINSFVMDSKNIRWCPGNNCRNAIKVKLLKEKTVCCSCGTFFCFGCGLSPHPPADCKMLRTWNNKIATEGGDSEWKVKFTKECPKCDFLIHKEGGCQYMNCSNCNHKFCWICLGAFDHKQHNCSAFKQQMNEEINVKRFELLKYNHYFTRYKTHEQSIKLEDRILKRADILMNQAVEKGNSWFDVQHFKKAALQLMEARNILKNTYVYGYYLPPHVNREIFEYLQAELEEKTEKLSQILENEQQIYEKSAILNATENVKKRLASLIEGLSDHDIVGGTNTQKTFKADEFEDYQGWIYNPG